jgi:RND superfamily putative drug exporter
MQNAGASGGRPRRSIALRLARSSSRRPRLTVLIWLLTVIASAGLYYSYRGAFQSQDSFLTTPESKRAQELIQSRLPGAEHDTEVMVVRSATCTVDEAAFQVEVRDLRRRLLALGPDVISVTSMSNAPAQARPFLVSKDRHATLLAISLAGDLVAGQREVGGVLRVAHAADGRNGFTVVVTGAAAWGYEGNQLAASDLRRGELIGIPAALVILVVVFGALVAAVVPLILAGAAVAVAAAASALLGTTFSLSVYALNIIMSMGLAVGIDYSLFVISRFREERRRALEVDTAVSVTGATANRAVFFSGMTVVLSLLGMLIVPYSVFTSLGAGAISVVLAAVGTALTLLPAALTLLGDRVNLLSVRRASGRGRSRAGATKTAASLWARAAALIMRRPALSLALGAALLLAVAAPTFLMQRGVSGIASLPDSLSTKRGYELLSREFSAGWTASVQVVIDAPLLRADVMAALARFRTELSTDGRFQPVSLQTAADGSLAVLTLLQNQAPTSERALANVRYLRAHLIPAAFSGSQARVYVGGVTAAYVDGLHMIDLFQPIVIAVVLALSFVLLLVAFRSLIVATTCILMNLLSVGASYGALVLVFQYGVGAKLFGFQRVDRIEAWVPLLMFCVLFGLSMDYQVFLLSRIRERFDRSADTREAVGFGIASTAGIITGAALIMVAVFAGLASGQLVMFQQLGFGLAVAVFLDATLVRTVVAPATIALIGDRYWWLPAWLEWLPQVNVSGHYARLVAGR